MSSNIAAPTSQSFQNIPVDMVVSIFSFLTPQEIALSLRVNKTFAEGSKVDPALAKELLAAKLIKKYIEGVGSKRTLSKWGSEVNRLSVNPTHKELAVFVKLLREGGNQKIEQFPFEDYLYIYFDGRLENGEVDVAKFVKEIFDKHPNKRTRPIYRHMREIIGRPNRPHAGRDAFHDKNGMKSTSEQKATAIYLFLFDKAKKYYKKQPR